MTKTSLTMLAAGMAFLPGLAMADDHGEQDFSTVTKVHYVQDCMTANSDMNVYESVHKCSCVIDKLDMAFTQQEFDNIHTGYMYKNLPADRGAQFRDDAVLNETMDEFDKVIKTAYKECKLN
ncbi:MAG TPA: hypothetical protein VFM76_02490 [Methylophaga sp.]|nr:hypothetical protein [Methylophaga sp.]